MAEPAHFPEYAAPLQEMRPTLHILEAQFRKKRQTCLCHDPVMLAQDTTLRCRDVAVLSNQMSDYKSILETAMERHAPPYYMDEKESMRCTPFLVYLHTLPGTAAKHKAGHGIAAAPGKNGYDFRKPEEIAVLENYRYTWQIEGKTWNTAFTGGSCEDAESVRKAVVALAVPPGKAAWFPYRCRILPAAVRFSDRTGDRGTAESAAYGNR
ncbi:MAG: hypothetical protein ACLUOF_03690 [Ruminococcus sp.]